MQTPATRPGWLRWRISGDELRPRPRLLLECPDDAAPAATAQTFARAGFDVTVCNGPGSCGGCALIETGRCLLVEDAEVVVSLLGLDDSGNAEVLAALATTYPSTLVIAEAAPADLAARPEIAARAEVLSRSTGSSR